jgi:hypothetical protein
VTTTPFGWTANLLLRPGQTIADAIRQREALESALDARPRSVHWTVICRQCKVVGRPVTGRTAPLTIDEFVAESFDGFKAAWWLMKALDN